MVEDTAVPVKFEAPVPNCKGLVYFHLKTQNFSNSLSHRIFRRMHGVLNIDEK